MLLAQSCSHVSSTFFFFALPFALSQILLSPSTKLLSLFNSHGHSLISRACHTRRAFVWFTSLNNKLVKTILYYKTSLYLHSCLRAFFLWSESFWHNEGARVTECPQTGLHLNVNTELFKHWKLNRRRTLHKEHCCINHSSASVNWETQLSYSTSYILTLFSQW